MDSFSLRASLPTMLRTSVQFQEPTSSPTTFQQEFGNDCRIDHFATASQEVHIAVVHQNGKVPQGAAEQRRLAISFDGGSSYVDMKIRSSPQETALSAFLNVYLPEEKMPPLFSLTLTPSLLGSDVLVGNWSSEELREWTVFEKEADLMRATAILYTQYPNSMESRFGRDEYNAWFRSACTLFLAAQATQKEAPPHNARAGILFFEAGKKFAFSGERALALNAFTQAERIFKITGKSTWRDKTTEAIENAKRLPS